MTNSVPYKYCRCKEERKGGRSCTGVKFRSLPEAFGVVGLGCSTSLLNTKATTASLAPQFLFSCDGGRPPGLGSPINPIITSGDEGRGRTGRGEMRWDDAIVFLASTVRGKPPYVQQ